MIPFDTFTNIIQDYFTGNGTIDLVPVITKEMCKFIWY